MKNQMDILQLLPGETVVANAGGDCWETPTMISAQVAGQFTFTNQRILFRGNGISDAMRIVFAIPYSEITAVEPYRVVFFATGIRIFVNGELYRISLRKRDQYIELIQSNMH